MGFSIPDSPRGQSDAATQASGTAHSALASANAGLRGGFRPSLAVRRRNAIIPGSLSFDAMGSPRSPYVFLTQNHRQALSQAAQQQEQMHQQPTPSSQMASKPVPSIRRHGEQAGAGDWHSPADRLALFIQRYAVAEDKVARQLGWPLEQLRAYLSPEARRLKAASDLCADLNLPAPFETAITFSICEQVAAYRSALDGREWIGNNPFHVKGTGITLPTSTCSAGYIETMPPLDGVLRDEDDARKWLESVCVYVRREEGPIWTPVEATDAADTEGSELFFAVNDWLSSRWPWSTTCVTLTNTIVTLCDVLFDVVQEHRLPRPINPFIVYCQMQKEENEKRRREHVLEMRDRAIAEWEEDEARRKGLLASGTLEASTEHSRGLLLEVRDESVEEEDDDDEYEAYR
ncbi:hypothetical protein BBJ28_00000873 [Nothophytophthora sp. Chile5]|nr:hypothetical protein BBJ28_00000873 [Nothophytophthora sp. Chile5]